MKFEFELKRLSKMYVEETRERFGDLMAGIAQTVLESFLNWYLASQGEN